MNTSANLCRICGEGELTPQLHKNRVEYNGSTSELDLHLSVCDVCGSEQINAVQLRNNRRAMMAFQKKADGFLEGAEVRAIRERLGINQAAASKIFGGGPVAFSKYESDDVRQSEAMDKLLRLAAELPAAFELLARRAGIQAVLSEVQWESAEGWLTESSRHTSTKRPKLTLVSSSPRNDQPPRYGT